METGDVLRVQYLFADRAKPGEYEEPRRKWLVLLRCDEAEPDVTFLIASTLRPDQGATRRFEVPVSPDEGGFTMETVVDCRWPNTLPRAWFTDAEDMGKLSDETMEEVGKALVYGLRLHEIARRRRA